MCIRDTYVLEHLAGRVESTARAERIQVATFFERVHQAEATRYRRTDGAGDVGKRQRLALAGERLEQVQRPGRGFYIHEIILRRLKTSGNPSHRTAHEFSPCARAANPVIREAGCEPSLRLA